MTTLVASITAKTNIITDALLSFFVTVSTHESTSGCGSNVISGSLTGCGEQYVDIMAQRILFHLLSVVSNLVPVLMTWANTYSDVYDPGTYIP